MRLSPRMERVCMFGVLIKTDKYLVRLLMAKSRVAPIKPTTIPRLQSYGAVIGARLYEKMMSSLQTRGMVNRVYCWPDSTIVLGRLKMMPTKLQLFVRNRVAEVLDKAVNYTWRHDPTNKNRAVAFSDLQGQDLLLIQHPTVKKKTKTN